MSFRLNNSEFSIEFTRNPASVTDLDRASVSSMTRYGGTVVYCSVTVGEWAGYGSCLPLSVSYSERSYAINRIPGGFAKREPKNRDNEVLIGRLVDRAIRPTIEDSFRFRTNVCIIVFSYNPSCPIETVCITAASATLAAAGVPCHNIVGVKINHTQSGWDLGNGESSVCIAGNGYGLTTMELASHPLSIEKVVEGVHFALPTVIAMSDYIRQALSKIKKLHHTPVPVEQKSISSDGRLIVDIYSRNDVASIIKQSSEFIAKWESKDLGKFRWNQLVRSVLRSNMLWTLKRLDQRTLDEIRPITIQNNYLPIQNSCLFARGRTKAMCSATVSSSNDSQTFESLDGNEARRFLLHYNYISGDDKVSRRDIGHGNLARNALKFAVNQDKFVRVVSEVIESDGSSSMATVCGACCALRSAGILNEIVGGVSVGLLLEGYVSRFMVDMTALEDNLSDMDLKIAGTTKGLTALQIDLKVPILPWNVFENGLYFGFEHLLKIIGILGDSSKSKFDRQNDRFEPRNENKSDYVKPDHNKKYDNQKQERSEEIIYPVIEEKEVQPQENKQPQSNKHSQGHQKDKNYKQKSGSGSSKINIKFEDSFIGRIDSLNLVETLRKENNTNLVIKNNLVSLTGPELSSGVNKFLTLLFDIGKEMYYARVERVSNLTCEVSMLDGKKSTVKLDEPNPDLKKGAAVCIYKGKFGRWTFYTILN